MALVKLQVNQKSSSEKLIHLEEESFVSVKIILISCCFSGYHFPNTPPYFLDILHLLPSKLFQDVNTSAS